MCQLNGVEVAVGIASIIPNNWRECCIASLQSSYYCGHSYCYSQFIMEIKKPPDRDYQGEERRCMDFKHRKVKTLFGKTLAVKLFFYCTLALKAH